MKNCLICTTADQDDAVPTCSACGEASWSASEASSDAPKEPTKKSAKPKKS